MRSNHGEFTAEWKHGLKPSPGYEELDQPGVLERASRVESVARSIKVAAGALALSEATQLVLHGSFVPHL